MSPEPLTPMHDALLAAVAKQSASAAQSADKLAEAAGELKNAFQFTRRMKVTMLIGGVALALLLALCTGLVILAIGNHQVIDTIKDCTTTQGRCFRDSAARTGAAVALINAEDIRGFEAVQVCSSSSSVMSQQTADSDKAYFKAIQTCVSKILAHR